MNIIIIYLYYVSIFFYWLYLHIFYYIHQPCNFDFQLSVSDTMDNWAVGRCDPCIYCYWTLCCKDKANSNFRRGIPCFKVTKKYKIKEITTEKWLNAVMKEQHEPTQSKYESSILFRGDFRPLHLHLFEEKRKRKCSVPLLPAWKRWTADICVYVVERIVWETNCGI